MIFKQIRDSIYYAGSDGEIYSTFRGGFKKLSKGIQSTGRYYTVNIKLDTIYKTYRVHRLICETFNGIPETLKHQCSHLDGNWKHNIPENLIWELAKTNLDRKKEHGTDDKGYKNSRAKITEQQLIEIRQMLNNKVPHHIIGEKFGVNRVFITKINTGYRYKNQGISNER